MSLPTIGIGAGPGCDGQVQVIHDLLGAYQEFVPRHAKQYAQLAEIMRGAFSDYIKEVTEGTFPTEKHSYTIDPQIIQELEGSL